MKYFKMGRMLSSTGSHLFYCPGQTDVHTLTAPSNGSCVSLHAPTPQPTVGGGVGGARERARMRSSSVSIRLLRPRSWGVFGDHQAGPSSTSFPGR